MKLVRVATEPSYEVRIGPDVLHALPEALAPHRRSALLADERVHELHAARLPALAALPRLFLPAGEACKCFRVLEQSLAFLAATELDRRSALVVLGGGAAGDLGGLAAGLYMRGIAHVHVPTTLLAQVDSSVGGKCAINLEQGKNLVGLVHQPRLVLADVGFLATLPEEEWLSGVGEIVKTAWVGGEGEIAELEGSLTGLLAREPEALESVVAAAVAVKARVVASDPLERGARRALNLGHTFAHGIEHAAGYGRIPHGIAVATGVALALRASSAFGLARDPAALARLERLLERLGLPASLSALRARYGVALTTEELLRGMRHDKKGAAGEPELVLVRAPGELVLGHRPGASDLAALLDSDRR